MDIESSSTLRINITISQPPSSAISKPKPLPSYAPNDPETPKINKPLKQLLREEYQRLSLHPPPPVTMSPEQREMMIQKLPQARELLSRVDTAMRVGFKVDDNEYRIRQILIKRLLLSQQFSIDGHKLMEAPPVDHFTMTMEELESSIKILKKYLGWVMIQVSSADKGEAQHETIPSAQLQAPAQAQGQARSNEATAAQKVTTTASANAKHTLRPKPTAKIQLPKHSLGAHPDSECFTIFPQKSIDNVDKILFTRNLRMVRGTSLVTPMKDGHGGIWAWTAYLTPGARLEISKYPNIMGMVLDDEAS